MPALQALLLPMTAIIAGVVLINLHAIQTSSHQVTEGKRQMLGILCAFAALLCWSRYAVENSRCLKNSLTPVTSGLLIGLCTGCISVLLWLIASIFRFSAVDLSLPEHTQTLLDNEHDVSRGLLMAGISGVESLFPASSGITDRADGGFETLSRCYMVLSIHSAFRISRKVPLLRC
ncbi:hypothetical protein [Klebsiella pneumoniae]|uniref:hypothetical protein n=1 Tax=Klebsiella pneumoniae TaxID=573 RepID=UPI00296EE6B2|nr:hypothetical protein [Klebsiella pneumoniae]